MTASRTGLAILAALALALAVVHLAIGGSAAPASRAPFADLVAGEAGHELEWIRPGQPPLVIAGVEGGPWRMKTPTDGPVDPSAATDVVGALRGARWQRVAASRPGPARFTLRVDKTALEVGTDVAGAGTWIGRGGRYYLVEPWVATALDRDPLSLRERALLAPAVPGFDVIEITGRGGIDLRLEGTPLRVHGDQARFRLAPDVAATLLEHLAGVRVETLVIDKRPWPVLTELEVHVDGRHPRAIRVLGPCPDNPELVWVNDGSGSDVCVGAEPLIKLQLAARAIAASPEQVADPRPVELAPTEVTLLSGATLRWRGAAAEVADAAGTAYPADDDAAARVAAVLTGPATPVWLGVWPRNDATIRVTTGTQTRTLHLLADVLVTDGSSIGHRLPPDAIAALRLDAAALRDRLLWRTEPSLLTQLQIEDGGMPRTVAIDDEWARDVADALAAPRAVRYLPAPAAPVRRSIVLTFAPPPTAGAAPEIHRLELGKTVSDGCAANADGTAVVLSPDLCRVLAR